MFISIFLGDVVEDSQFIHLVSGLDILVQVSSLSSTWSAQVSPGRSLPPLDQLGPAQPHAVGNGRAVGEPWHLVPFQ